MGSSSIRSREEDLSAGIDGDDLRPPSPCDTALPPDRGRARSLEEERPRTDCPLSFDRALAGGAGVDVGSSSIRSREEDLSAGIDGDDLRPPSPCDTALPPDRGRARSLEEERPRTDCPLSFDRTLAEGEEEFSDR